MFRCWSPTPSPASQLQHLAVWRVFFWVGAATSTSAQRLRSVPGCDVLFTGSLGLTRVLTQHFFSKLARSRPAVG